MPDEHSAEEMVDVGIKFRQHSRSKKFLIQSIVEGGAASQTVRSYVYTLEFSFHVGVCPPAKHL